MTPGYNEYWALQVALDNDKLAPSARAVAKDLLTKYLGHRSWEHDEGPAGWATAKQIAFAETLVLEGLNYHLAKEQGTAIDKTPVVTWQGMTGLLTLLGAAKLKHPKIVLALPDGKEIAITKAPMTGTNPGALYIKSATGGQSYLGKVTPQGYYKPAYSNTNTALGIDHKAIAEFLCALGDNPADIAAKHGKLTGRCCFCNIKLDSEDSLAMGYGPVCAKSYGLPWGAGATKNAAKAALEAYALADAVGTQTLYAKVAGVDPLGLFNTKEVEIWTATGEKLVWDAVPEAGGYTIHTAQGGEAVSETLPFDQVAEGYEQIELAQPSAFTADDFIKAKADMPAGHLPAYTSNKVKQDQINNIAALMAAQLGPDLFGPGVPQAIKWQLEQALADKLSPDEFKANYESQYSPYAGAAHPNTYHPTDKFYGPYTGGAILDHFKYWLSHKEFVLLKEAVNTIEGLNWMDYETRKQAYKALVKEVSAGHLSNQGWDK